MANPNEPTPAGLAGHYTALLHTATQARANLFYAAPAKDSNNARHMDERTVDAVEAAIKAIAGRIVTCCEQDASRGRS